MSLIAIYLLVALPCGIHAVRTGRVSPWLFIVLLFPVFGSLIYVITQVLPDLKNSAAANSAKHEVKRLLDPEAERRKAEAQLAMADTVSNRLSLARSAAARGDFEQAATQFQACLKGAYENDAPIMLELAQAQFAGGKAVECRATLDALKAANPAFRSPEGHLLYARALEAEGKSDEALYEYGALCEGNFPGEEARARRALLLVKLGRAPEARAILGEMQARFNAAPKFYQKNEQAWLDAVSKAVA